MHEMVQYSLNNAFCDKPKSAKLNNTNSALHMDKFMMDTRSDLKRTGSFIVGQKLRESKWFSHEELKILCAVLETGFVVETKNHNEEKGLGVAVWTPGFGM